MAKKILIVDDDICFVTRLLNSLKTKDNSFSIADSLNRAKFLIEENQFDMVLANVKVPGGSSLDLRNDELDLRFMSSLESDYNYTSKLGEKCYHKYDYQNSLKELLENV